MRPTFAGHGLLMSGEGGALRRCPPCAAHGWRRGLPVAPPISAAVRPSSSPRASSRPAALRSAVRICSSRAPSVFAAWSRQGRGCVSIHGDADDFVPPSDPEALWAQALRDHTRKWLLRGGRHADVIRDPEYGAPCCGVLQSEPGVMTRREGAIPSPLRFRVLA